MPAISARTAHPATHKRPTNAGVTTDCAAPNCAASGQKAASGLLDHHFHAAIAGLVEIESTGDTEYALR